MAISTMSRVERGRRAVVALAMTLALFVAWSIVSLARAQEPPPPSLPSQTDDGTTPPELIQRDPYTAVPPELRQKQDALIQSLDSPEIVLELDVGLAQLMRTRLPVSRVAIADPSIVDLVQHGPRELELIGRNVGATSLTMWFGEGEDRPNIRYLVQVGPRRGRRYRQQLREFYYGELERRINALFPNSSIQLLPVLDKLLVRGQARDPEEAQRIMSFLQSQAPRPGQGLYGVGGTAIDPSEGEANLGASQIIDMLDVPGEQNIMLKARIAEVSRSALRQFGFNFNFNNPNFNFIANFGVQPNIQAIFDGGEVTLLFEAFENNGLVKVLAEPNVVTINGGTASFITGGAFPVPTVVGLGGVGAASTTFRGIGTQLIFTPTIIDKDRIRLTVATSFSTINNALSVAGVPGTDNRAVQTIVDLREGQWLALGGLIQDQQAGGKSRIPLVGNLPLLEYFFSTKNVTRDETEVIILVSAELVRPMDAEHVPLMLPGQDITEPTDYEFYIEGRYEGRQGVYHRSTVWPEYRFRIRDALREARRTQNYQTIEHHYISGDHGFSR